MNTYEIAGLKINMAPKYETLTKQAQKYLTEYTDTPDFTVQVSDEFLQEFFDNSPHLSMSDCEYIQMGAEFYSELLQHDGFLLHSCGVALDNCAYLFSAPSGTGKSTHVMQWMERFKDKKPFIINDDKPAIRYIDNKFFACGTPFSGKTDFSENALVPLKGICVLQRGEKNEIERIDAKTAAYSILNQTIRPKEKAYMLNLLELVDKLILSVPVYRLKCNISLEAAEVAYNEMSKG